MITRVMTTYIRHNLQYRVYVGATPTGPLFDTKTAAEAYAATIGASK